MRTSTTTTTTTFILFFLFLHSLFLDAKRYKCDNECYNGGYCDKKARKCVCSNPWTGEDCSLFLQYLNSGAIETSIANYHQWRYYQHRVASKSRILSFQLTRVGNGAHNSSCNLYVQYEDYPTLSSYVAKNASLSSSSQWTVELIAESGVYYAGVYGSSQDPCDYSLTVKESYSCGDGCGSNGKCVDGQCVCDEIYFGQHCEKMIPITELLPDIPQTGVLYAGEWSFYSTKIRQGTGLKLTYTLTEDRQDSSANYDCDLYIRTNSLPTFWSYNYSDMGADSVTKIPISNPVLDIYYYAGVYGVLGCSFEFSVTVEERECPTKCSGHGTCVGEGCRCNNGFTGKYCEWLNAPLRLNQVVEGFVTTNFWNYFTFRAITENSVIVTISQFNDVGGDCDLFIKADDKPTRFDFDLADRSFEETFSVSIHDIGDHQWFLGVFGAKSCHYQISIDVAVVCDCSFDNPNGYCEETQSECICSDGWGGIDCSVPVSILINQVPYRNQVRKNEWFFLKFMMENSTTAVVSLKERSTRGLLWLFVCFTDFPTLSSYDITDKGTNTEIHEVSVNDPQAKGRFVFVGVYGDPYGLHENDFIEFDMMVWWSAF